MEPRRLTHTIRRIERICRGCWEVQTQTEDGHRFTAFGVTRQQALYRAHQKARAYGRYAYPTMNGAASCRPAPARRRLRPVVGACMLRPSTATRAAAWGRYAGVEGGVVRDDEHPVTDAEHLTHTHELLTHAARRAQDRPVYVAWALARVQAREGLSDEALAARLGLPTVDLPRLALCRRPRPDQWDADLTQIAGTFCIDPNTLAAILRAVETPGGPQHDRTA